MKIFPVDILKSVLDEFLQALEEADHIRDSLTRQCFNLDPSLGRTAHFKRAIMKTVQSDKNTPTLTDLHTTFRNQGRKGLSQALRRMYIDNMARTDSINDREMTQKKIADLRYPTEWFPHTRAIQRVIHLHIGPTNSGKTYQALKRLESAKTGFYAGPLRLLAHEVFTRFRQKGLDCGLVTGDEIKSVEHDPPLTSHTIEMAPVQKHVDVAVVDEIQMIGDADRGWAWTKAVLGSRAKELHLCGEARTLPLIRELAASTGDTLHVHNYERLNPLKVMDHSLYGDLRNLEKGDCVVLFTVIGLHAMKKEIELRTGRRCAIVYGSLPPEIRAQQAELFNNPDNSFDFLVASDAIGMGLNLSIKRIIFESTWKSDGRKVSQLSISALKQIAGRAGRYRVAGQTEDPSNSTSGDRASDNVGWVTSLTDADLPYIQQAMISAAQPIVKAGLLPPTEVLERFSKYFPSSTPFQFILRRLHHLATVNPTFFLCHIDDQCAIAASTDSLGDLSIADRYTICASPATVKQKHSGRTPVVQALARGIAVQDCDLLSLTEVDFEALDSPVSGDRKYLERLEQLHKALVLYIWLSYRFSGIFVHRAVAFYTKSLVEQKMDRALSEFSANRRLREEILFRNQVMAEKLAAEAAEKERKERGPPTALEEADNGLLKPQAISAATNGKEDLQHINSRDCEQDDSDTERRLDDAHNDEAPGLSDDIEVEECNPNVKASDLRDLSHWSSERENASEVGLEETAAKDPSFQDLLQEIEEFDQHSSSESGPHDLSNTYTAGSEGETQSTRPTSFDILDPSVPDSEGDEIKPSIDVQIHAPSGTVPNADEMLDGPEATLITDGQYSSSSGEETDSLDNAEGDGLDETHIQEQDTVEESHLLGSLRNILARITRRKVRLEEQRDRLLDLHQGFKSQDAEQRNDNLEALSTDLSQAKEDLEQLVIAEERLAKLMPLIRRLSENDPSQADLQTSMRRYANLLKRANKLVDSMFPDLEEVSSPQSEYNLFFKGSPDVDLSGKHPSRPTEIDLTTP